MTYQVPVPSIYSKQQFAAGTPIVLPYENGDVVRVEPRPPSPNMCRFGESSSRTLFRPQANGDGTRMQGVLGESRASCRIKLRLPAAAVRGARRQLLTMTHTSTASSPPMPYQEFLAEGRASVGLYSTASVCARSSQCALDELSFSCLYHEYCCCGTCYNMLYNSTAYKVPLRTRGDARLVVYF